MHLAGQMLQDRIPEVSTDRIFEIWLHLHIVKLCIISNTKLFVKNTLMEITLLH